MRSYIIMYVFVKFISNNCVGNERARSEDEIDYYTSYSFPNFATVEAYSSYFILNISIVQDCILENNELFRVAAIPSELPDGHTRCTADVVIVDDDGMKVDDLYIYNVIYTDI